MIYIICNNVRYALYRLYITHKDMVAIAEIDIVKDATISTKDCIDVYSDNELLLRGICVVAEVKHGKLCLVVHGKDNTYNQQLQQLIEQYKYNDVLFQKAQSHSLLLSQLTCNRVTGQIDTTGSISTIGPISTTGPISMINAVREIKAVPVYFTDSLEKSINLNKINAFNLVLMLRWKYGIQAVENVCNYTTGRLTSNVPRFQNGQKLGNFHIISANENDVQIAWSTIVNRKECVTVRIVLKDHEQADEYIMQCTDNVKNLTLFLNLNNSCEDKYNENAQYTVGEVVVYFGLKYICIIDTVVGQFNQDHWQLIVLDKALTDSLYFKWLLKITLKMIEDWLYVKNYDSITKFKTSIAIASGFNKGDELAEFGTIDTIELIYEDSKEYAKITCKKHCKYKLDAKIIEDSNPSDFNLGNQIQILDNNIVKLISRQLTDDTCSLIHCSNSVDVI